MKINPEFKEFLLTKDVKFTFIIGSGIHRQFNDEESILSSWDVLLKSISPETLITNEYHMNFEKIISNQKKGNEDSRKTEERVIGWVQDKIKAAQNNALKNQARCYPDWLFNPRIVEDVISLNFDEVPEKVLSKRKGVKVRKYVNDSSFSDSSNNSYAYLSTRYKTIDFGKIGTIRFWHPHGTVDNNKSIVLGLHRYAHMVKNVLRMRDHYSHAKKTETDELTWYTQMVNNPVIILGAGMSGSEWDMWIALISRNRANNNLPIFQMRDCECKLDHRHQWFQPLFTGVAMNEQWKELKKLFNTI